MRRFDPNNDYPPVGAFVNFYGERFNFIDTQVVGWQSADKNLFTYPFSPQGRYLAAMWVEQGQRVDA